jgi:hypothetical protein
MMFSHLARNKRKYSDSVFNSVGRVISILGERGIYKQDQVDELTAALNGTQKQKREEVAILKQVGLHLCR